jgi:hypothetical protein
MVQALGHDGSTHGAPGVRGPFSKGGVGIQNPCGDLLRDQIIHSVQTGNGAANPSDDASGAPDFREWPVWNDITHQKMWIDWLAIRGRGSLWADSPQLRKAASLTRYAQRGQIKP